MIHAFVEYAAVSAVFCALTGLGALPALLIDRACAPPRLLRLPLLAIAGWGLAALVSAFGALAELDQFWLARGLLAVGLALLLPRRRPAMALLLDLAILLVIIAPMGLLVASTPAVAFDEFAQWLPNSRFLVEHGHFWMWPEWLGLSNEPGYPNGSSVIALLASQFAGPDVEAPFKTFVTLLLGCFGAALAALAGARCSGVREGGGTARTALLTGGCLIAFLDPFMDPRIGFTAYTDTPSAVVLALAALAATYALDAARRGAPRAATGWFAWAGLLSLPLVLCRVTNVVLIAALVAGTGLILTLRKTRFRLWLPWAAVLLAPPALGAFLWKAYLWRAQIGLSMPVRSAADWYWGAPFAAVRALLIDRFAANPLLAGGALGFLGLATLGVIVVWRRGVPAVDDRIPSPVFLALAGMVVLCDIAFLAWAYMAVFSAEEAATAASLWRYLSQLGPMLVLAAFCAILPRVPEQHWSRLFSLVAALSGLFALVVLPAVGRGYYRLDCRFPDIVAARMAIAELRPALAALSVVPPRHSGVAVIDPAIGDWVAYVLSYDLGWPVSRDHVRFRVARESLSQTEDWAWDQGVDALLDLSSLGRAALRAGAVIPSVTLLARPTTRGEPWPVLAKTAPHSPARCAAWGN